VQCIVLGVKFYEYCIILCDFVDMEWVSGWIQDRVDETLFYAEILYVKGATGCRVTL